MFCASWHSMFPRWWAVWWLHGFNGYKSLSIHQSQWTWICSLQTKFHKIFFLQPKKEYLVWPVVLRVLFIPLFLVCNYHPLNIERVMPIYIKNDWIFWAIGIVMGFSSGYLRYANRQIDSSHSVSTKRNSPFVIIFQFVGNDVCTTNCGTKIRPNGRYVCCCHAYHWHFYWNHIVRCVSENRLNYQLVTFVFVCCSQHAENVIR